MSTLSNGRAAPASALAEVLDRVKGVLLDRRQTTTVLRGAALGFLIRGGGAALIFPAIVLLGFSHAMGAYVGPRYWTIFFLVIAATRLATMLAAVVTEPRVNPKASISTLGAAAPLRSR